MGISSSCCEAEVSTSTVPEYFTEEYGIPLVLINSARVQTCNMCKAELSTVVQYPNRLIAAAAVGRIVESAKLTGPEIKFLRKALEKSASELAELLEVTPETISRWENDKYPISPSMEKLLRIYTGVLLSEKAPAIDFSPQKVLSLEITSVHDIGKPAVMALELVKVKARRGEPSEFGFERAAA